MKTYPIKQVDGGVRLRGFEIDNAFIWIGTISKILKRVPGTSNIVQIHFQEVKIKFLYHDVPCIVWEPFGDNSRYWIGAEDTSTSSVDIKELQDAFVAHQSPFLRLLSFFK